MPYLSPDGDFERIFMTSTKFVDQFVGSSLWTWGANNFGQLGDGTQIARSSPGTVAGGGVNWKQVTGNSSFAGAVKTDGTLWMWGISGNGRLGDGITADRSSPATISAATNWKQVFGSGNSTNIAHTAAIKTDGTLWTWGLGTSGQLGDGTTITKSSPVTTAGGGTNWKEAACGGSHTAAIKTDGTLWTWGNSNLGQLGDGTTSSRLSPVTALGALVTTVYDTSNFQAPMTIDTGYGGPPIFTANTPFSGVGGSMKGNAGALYTPSSTNYRLDGDFTLEYWFNSTDTGSTFNNMFSLGANYNLGIFVRLNSSDSIYMSNGTNYTNGYVNDLISLAPVNTWNHLAFSRTGTTLKIFVNGTQRYTGTNTVIFNSASTGVYLFTAPSEAGRMFQGYLSNFRIVKGTGLYSSNFTPSTVPLTPVPNTVFLFTGTPIYNTVGWKQVSCGNDHTAAVKTDGTLWTWGGASNGRLGDGTTANRSSPGTTAGGGTNWKQVACGNLYTAAVKTDGTLWAWGHNSLGQLGDGTTTNRSSPVTTVGGGTNWKQVSTGAFHTAAIKTDGTLWTCGYNSGGRLGDGTTTNRSSPIQPINNLSNWKQVSCGYNFTTAVAQN